MGLMFQPFMKYADFQGRARRSEYWLWALFLFLANSVLQVIQFAVMGGTMAGMANHGSSEAAAMQMGSGVMIISGIKIIFALAVLIPSIAVSVRRMHDTNRTGWWIMFPTAVMIIALIIYVSVDGANFVNQMKNLQGMSKDSSDPAAAFAVLGAVFKPLFWVFVPTFLAKIVTFVFRVLDGTAGPNRFGDDPKGRGTIAAKVF